MAHTATIRLASSNGLFARLFAALDRALLSWANAAIRRGDIPYFGL
ncbi:MAG: hypothetical protein HY242_04000 [Afipia sp.]|nr:hypothetical protein [Afipia sp.]